MRANRGRSGGCRAPRAPGATLAGLHATPLELHRVARRASEGGESTETRRCMPPGGGCVEIIRLRACSFVSRASRGFSLARAARAAGSRAAHALHWGAACERKYSMPRPQTRRAASRTAPALSGRARAARRALPRARRRARRRATGIRASTVISESRRPRVRKAEREPRGWAKLRLRRPALTFLGTPPGRS